MQYVCAMFEENVKSTSTTTSHMTVMPSSVEVNSPLALSSRTTPMTTAGERSIIIEATIMPMEN